MDGNISKELNLLLANFKRNIKLEIHTCIPVEVVKFDSSTARVDVKPVYNEYKIGTKMTLTLETGEVIGVEEDTEPFIIADVPIVAMINSNAKITMPISKGDCGLLMISERDIYNWKENIAKNLQSLRKFDINDGFFIPFINQNISSYSNDGIEINYKGKKIKITDSLISITGDTKITGDLEILGDFKILGNLQMTGNITLTGSLGVTGAITTTGDAIIGGISFLGHKHTSTAPGSPTSAPLP